MVLVVEREEVGHAQKVQHPVYLGGRRVARRPTRSILSHIRLWPPDTPLSVVVNL
uniref:Uncharacterized protein n=1 Tax=Arundo donax TaxID=35708 RepID=A0A0A9FFL4_ARUDO